MDESAALALIDVFYPEPSPLKDLLLKHSRQVCDKALALMENPVCAALAPDRDTVVCGALLHDIGIFRCHAPKILCMGTEPYLAHGMIGAELLRQYMEAHHVDLEAFARICERHTGTGLTAEDILAQGLPVPARDLMPETVEEKLICFADKFYSKSGDMQEKSLPHIRRSMEKFGSAPAARFDELCRMFGVKI